MASEWLGIGLAVAKILLRAADKSDAANARDDAYSAAWSALRAARHDEPEMAEAIATRLVFQLGRIPPEEDLRDRVRFNVTALLIRFSEDDDAVIVACTQPDMFLEYARQHRGDDMRRLMPEQARLTFDRVLEAACAEFDRLAPSSPHFSAASLTDVLRETAIIAADRRQHSPSPPAPPAPPASKPWPMSPPSQPMLTRRPAPAPPPARAPDEVEPTLLATIDKAVRDVVTEGRVVFNPATNMRQGRSERVEVAIARSTDLDHELLASLRSTTKAQVETIETSPFMGVDLRGAGFEITALASREQLLHRTARWEFDVLPRRSGTRQLQVSVTMRIPIANRSDETMSVPVLERTVRVQVDPVYGSKQFVGKNWQWLIATTAGLAGVITAWIKLFGGQ